MHSESADLRFDTLLQHFAEEEKPYGAVTPPIVQTSLFVFDQMDELLRAMVDTPAGPPHHYGRLGNPTVEIAERKIARLEGMEACKLFGCGMGAITAAVMSCVRAGSHIVMVDTAYGPARKLVLDYLRRFGVSVTMVRGEAVEEVLGAIRPETSLVYLETPTSLLFRIQDVPAIAKACRERGVATILDNTYSTPLKMRPAEMGVDMVVHSATKYLAGHSDLTAGALCASRARMDAIIRAEVDLLGAVLHPFSAWLLLRGMRTLSLRLARHEETANRIATWLEARSEVARVHHLGLPSHPQKELAERLIQGSTGLFSFEPRTQRPEKVKRFVDRLRLFGKGVSWGGFESLALALPVHPPDYPSSRWIVRLFCGLEDPHDLIADLSDAMSELED